MINIIINLCKNVGIIGLQCRNYLNHSVEERNIHFPQFHGLMVNTLNFERLMVLHQHQLNFVFSLRFEIFTVGDKLSWDC